MALDPARAVAELRELAATSVLEEATCLADQRHVDSSALVAGLAEASLPDKTIARVASSAV